MPPSSAPAAPPSPAPAAQPPASPSAPQPPAPPARPQGGGLLGGISIASIKPPKAAAPRLQAEVKPLTQDDLGRYWDETAAELGLADLMKEGLPHLADHPGQIEIDAQTTWFNEEFKPHRIDVMEALRRKSGMPMLDCKVNPLFVAKDEVIYSPTDKYNAMLQQNPKLLELRKLFPMIDY